MTTNRDVICGDGKAAEALTVDELEALHGSLTLHYFHANALVPRLLATIEALFEMGDFEEGS